VQRGLAPHSGGWGIVCIYCRFVDYSNDSKDNPSDTIVALDCATSPGVRAANLLHWGGFGLEGLLFGGGSLFQSEPVSIAHIYTKDFLSSLHPIVHINKSRLFTDYTLTSTFIGCIIIQIY